MSSFPVPLGPVMSTLERIRSMVGSGYSHRHGSVEDRVTYVAQHAVDPDTRVFVRADERIPYGSVARVLNFNLGVIEVLLSWLSLTAAVLGQDAPATLRCKMRQLFIGRP